MFVRVLQQSRKRKAQKPAPVAAEEEDGSDEEAIEKSVLYAHKPSKRTSFLDQKLVEMGTDRIMRKQAKISKRSFAPEKRTTNQVMNQIRKVSFVLRCVGSSTLHLMTTTFWIRHRRNRKNGKVGPATGAASAAGEDSALRLDLAALFSG